MHQTDETRSATITDALSLGLTEAEYDSIVGILGRVPNYTELGMYSVLWSEHCSYKNSIAQLKTLPRSGGRFFLDWDLLMGVGVVGAGAAAPSIERRRGQLPAGAVALGLGHRSACACPRRRPRAGARSRLRHAGEARREVGTPVADSMWRATSAKNSAGMLGAR